MLDQRDKPDNSDAGQPGSCNRSAVFGDHPFAPPLVSVPLGKHGQHHGAGHGARRMPLFVSLIHSRVNRAICTLVIAAVLLLSSHPIWSPSRSTFEPLRATVRSLARPVQTSSASLLQVFQVYPPVLTASPNGYLEITDGSETQVVNAHKDGNAACFNVIAEYSFANSYGQPFVGTYEPPSCSFNRVTWNLTVVSAGRQYDRLGM